MAFVTATTPTGRALDPRLYIDPTLLEAEQELIFERTWQLAGHVCALPRSAATSPRSRATSPCSSCATRRTVCGPTATSAATAASRLLSGTGQCKAAIRCRYHGWTYRFDGHADRRTRGAGLRRQARQAGARAAARPGRGAVRPRVRQPRPRRDAAGGPGRRPSAATRALPDPDRSSHSPPATGTQPANWKVIADNYIEGYHIPIAHPGADADARLQALRRRGPRALRLVRGAAALQAEQQPARARCTLDLVTPMPGLSDEDRRVWRYVFLYPNTTIDLYADQVNTWQMRPARGRPDP